MEISEKDIYSSVRSEGQHSMVYNSGYITHVEPDYEQTTNNGDSSTMGDSFEHVTINPVYEDVGKTDTTEYNHLFSLSRTSKQIYSQLMLKKQTTGCKLSCLAVVATLAVVLSIAAVLGIITAQASLHNEIGQQETLAEQAKNCACTTALANSTRSPQDFENLEDRLNTTMEELDVLKNMVTQISLAYQQLQQEHLSLQSSVDTFRLDQITLQSDVTTLKNQISSPVNLYQNCYEQTVECYLSPTMGRYWRQCSTGELPISITVSLTCTCMHALLLIFILQ